MNQTIYPYLPAMLINRYGEICRYGIFHTFPQPRLDLYYII